MAELVVDTTERVRSAVRHRSQIIENLNKALALDRILLKLIISAPWSHISWIGTGEERKRVLEGLASTPTMPFQGFYAQLLLILHRKDELWPSMS